MAFNYNPSDYLMDYSWVGEMGQHLSNVASKFPSLMKLNKEIKENREFSKIAKSQTAEMISEMDDEVAINLASEMGRGNLSPNDAKMSLIKMIPDHGEMDDVKSAQEYTKKLSDEFYIPLFQAGVKYNSRTNTDKLTPGTIVASLKAGKIRGEVAKSPEMQQEMELYNRGRVNKLDETFDVAKEKRAEGYKIAAEGRASEENKRDKELEYDRGAKIAKLFGQNLPPGSRVTVSDVLGIEQLLLKDDEVTKTITRASNAASNKVAELLNRDVDAAQEYIKTSNENLFKAKVELATILGDPKRKNNKELVKVYQERQIAAQAAVEGALTRLRELSSQNIDRANSVLRQIGEEEFYTSPVGIEAKEQMAARGAVQPDVANQKREDAEKGRFGTPAGLPVVRQAPQENPEFRKAAEHIFNNLPELDKQRTTIDIIMNRISEIGSIEETYKRFGISPPKPTTKNKNGFSFNTQVPEA